MSSSEVYRDRYYNPGYVYIAGSLSGRVLKIGVTINIHRQQAYLRNRRYGSIGDWMLLYYVHVDSGGQVEHDARRLLERYRQITWYEKDGSLQRGREIVKCSFGRALEALLEGVPEEKRSKGWRSARCDEFEFDRPPPPIEPVVYPLPNDWKPPAFLFFMKVGHLELSVRSSNCLRNDGNVYIGELIQKTEEEMLRTPIFGRKSLNEIKEILSPTGPMPRDEAGLVVGPAPSKEWVVPAVRQPRRPPRLLACSPFPWAETPSAFVSWKPPSS